MEAPKLTTSTEASRGGETQPGTQASVGAKPAAGALSPSGAPAPRGPAGVAPGADRVDIRPLDLPAALRIALIEARAALTLLDDLAAATAPLAGPAAPGPPPPRDPQAATIALLEDYLDAASSAQALAADAAALPDASRSRAWLDAVDRLQERLDSGLARAQQAVAAWRDVPAEIGPALETVRTQVAAAINDDAAAAWLLGPEWAGMAARLTRLRRRKRALRRRLEDPDPRSPEPRDESDEQAESRET